LTCPPVITTSEAINTYGEGSIGFFAEFYPVRILGLLTLTVDMKFNYLQTHSARRSFCSNEYLKGTDPLIIMSISGHRSHKSFMRYIKVSGDQFADKLEKIWAERGV
jgi:hypothetical protein